MYLFNTSSVPPSVPAKHLAAKWEGTTHFSSANVLICLDLITIDA